MDLLWLVGQILAAGFIVAFFLLAAVVILGTAVACFRTRPPARKAARGPVARRPGRTASPERAAAARS